ncbi:trypsin-like serine protease [Streptomyces sp. 205]|uniref:Trypsin-like serine protease n=1 Tax=Streptomyces coffeae TaxID=621382 RepID=A0ABS1N9B0_9ACTN|nr:trypsin-like serine protease [Streptomyces coffeae]
MSNQTDGDAWGIREGDFRTDNPGGKAGTCGGDSGAPALAKADGRWRLAGVTSRAVGDCASTPDIYPSVAEHQKRSTGSGYTATSADVPPQMTGGGSHTGQAWEPPRCSRSIPSACAGASFGVHPGPSRTEQEPTMKRIDLVTLLVQDYGRSPHPHRQVRLSFLG